MAGASTLPWTSKRSILGLLGWLALCFSAAIIGNWFPPGAWYAQLDKPSWTPPAAVFGPVWTTLYFLMGVAAWLVWRQDGFSAEATIALSLFLVQLALNAFWSIIFFGWQEPGIAFVELVVLWGAIVLTLIFFWRHNTLAGLLLVPYLLWTTFAGLLNFAIWQLNA